MVSVDLTPLVSVLAPLAYAAVVGAVGILVPAVLKRLGIANDTDLSNKLVTALDAGAGEAYRVALSHDGGLASVTVHNTAIAAGVSYVTAALPDTLTKLNITPDKVQAMVQARLGTLLASDPTVTAGTPAKIG
jgi:hypothetical protein